MVPLVNDAREAKELVSFVKYFPDGNRGVGVGLAHDNYTGGPVPEKLERSQPRATACSCRSRRRPVPRMRTRSRP